MEKKCCCSDLCGLKGSLCTSCTTSVLHRMVEKSRLVGSARKIVGKAKIGFVLNLKTPL